ncbi:hypothetical protein B0H14DRAFT_2557206 [Mycena olivaceomarginata]|nr:hypothetical protein B0H14DRAFT_2557206 [Mycena olivaceomarginata]
MASNTVHEIGYSHTIIALFKEPEQPSLCSYTIKNGFAERAEVEQLRHLPDWERTTFPIWTYDYLLNPGCAKIVTVYQDHREGWLQRSVEVPAAKISINRNLNPGEKMIRVDPRACVQSASWTKFVIVPHREGKVQKQRNFRTSDGRSVSIPGAMQKIGDAGRLLEKTLLQTVVQRVNFVPHRTQWTLIQIETASDLDESVKTKQTARKSTGGSAAAQLQRKNATASKTLPYSIASAINAMAVANGEVKLPKKVKKTTTGAPAPRVPLATETSPVVDFVDLILPPAPAFDSPATPGELVLQGPNFRVVGVACLDPSHNEDGDQVCYICRDGGEIVMCGQADCEAGICKKCLGDPAETLLHLPFICIQCYQRAEGNRKEQEKKLYRAKPYEGVQGRQDGQIIKFEHGLYLRSTLARPSPKSVLLMVYVLEDFPLSTTPIPIPGLVKNLEMLLPNNFAHLEVRFRLDLEDRRSSVASANAAIAKSLMRGKLSSIRKIFVLVVSHTSPGTGDLHYAPNDGASTRGCEVLDLLMPSSLLEAFVACGRTKGSHLIAFMTCGYMFTVPVSLSEVNTWLIARSIAVLFYCLIGFESDKFQPASSGHFLLALLERFYVEGSPTFLANCLGQAGPLTSHSGIVYLRGNGEKPQRYLWAHPVRAPFGVPVPISCLCGVPNGMRVPQGSGHQDLFSSALKLECTYCRRSQTFSKPADLVFTSKMAEGGIWVYRPLVFVV